MLRYFNFEPSFKLRSWVRELLRMQEIRSSKPPVVTGICDLNKSRARHHRSLKLGSKLKYLNKVLLLAFDKIVLQGNVVFCNRSNFT